MFKPCCSLFALLVGLTIGTVVAAEGPQTTLVLAPTPSNSRNSEGDFIHLADGSLLLIYSHYADSGSDHGAAHLASRISHDSGATWSDKSVKVVENTGDLNVMSVSLLRLAGEPGKLGPIALFYMEKNSLQDCRPQMRISHDEAKTWSEPTPIIPDAEIGYYVLNNDRVVQLPSGRLIVPVSQHHGLNFKDWSLNGKIRCYVSDDSGKTWRRGQEVPAPALIDGRKIVTQEPGVVQLSDGRLLLFARTDGGSQFLSYSQDNGLSWSQFVPSNIISPRSPATIERIPGTDTLLMLWNNHADIAPALKNKRTPYNSAISQDDGKTWQHVRTIEEDPTGWYCYTGLTFVDEHVVLAYCSRGLAQMSVTRIPLDWLQAEVDAD